MMEQVQIRVKPQEEKNATLIEKKLFLTLHLKGMKKNKDDVRFVLKKRSIDARHGNLKVVLQYLVYDKKEEASLDYCLPHWKKVKKNSEKVFIIGSGPAGLFAALKLLERGMKPIIIERGKKARQRKIDIAKISTQGLIDEDSNYCFGQGGAGTFSDGKLFSRSGTQQEVQSVLHIFSHFGADSNILTASHPHIGTEKLPTVIDNMTDFIQNCGGEILYQTKLLDFVLDSNQKERRIAGLKVQNVETKKQTVFPCNKVILATGHSAKDIYMLIAKVAPFCLEAKTFACGVRVEHKRSFIDGIQYHKKQNFLGAAEYRLSTQVKDRGVYSFCMCPGGFVVPTATQNESVVLNGMSSSRRSSLWSNAAIVVETRPEDIPLDFEKKAKDMGCPALKGLFYREYIEHLAYENAQGTKAPAQRLSDFLSCKKSLSLPSTSFSPGVVSSRLDLWLPPFISKRLQQGFLAFDKKMKGFVQDDALLLAPETRTSSPLRITRDKKTGECIALKGLFPAGEGAGYSGGITSCAIDGQKIAALV